MAIQQTIVAKVDRSQVDKLQKDLDSLKNIEIKANVKSNVGDVKQQRQFAAEAAKIQSAALAKEAKVSAKTTKTAFKDEKKLIDEYNAYRLKAAKTTDAKLQAIYNKEADNYKKRYVSLATSRMKSGTEYKMGDAAEIVKYYKRQEKATQEAIERYQKISGAKIDSKAQAQQYKDILAQQRSINTLYKEQAKYTSDSANYKRYAKTIEEQKSTLDGMVTSYGKLDKAQEAQLASLKQQSKAQVANLKLRKEAANYIDTIDAEYAGLSLNGDIKANSRMYRKYRGEIETIQQHMSDAINANDREGIVAAQKEWRNLRKEAEINGQAGMTMLDKLKDGFKNFGAYISSAAILGAVRRVGTEMYQNVKAIDSAMTELRKVTDNSESEYRDYQRSVRKTAFDIGSTQTNLISSTATFARLGYNLNEASGLGRNAALYASVGDEGMTADDAATYMVAIMKGFNIAADKSLHIVDALNEVGNNFAISSTGLGESLKRSGGALATGQNTFEEAIGLTVAANDATQDATATGTALKTISLRLRGMKTELQEAGEETDGMATSTAKLREDLIALANVDILEEGGQKFKSTFQIMREIAGNWGNLSDMNRAAIIEEVAGKRGASYFSSMMTNWEDAEEAYKTALESEGSAEKENENILSSIEGRTTRLKAVFESLSTDVISSKLVKDGLDAAIVSLRAIDTVFNKIGGGGSIVGGIALVKLLNGTKKAFSDTYHTLNAEGIDIGTSLVKSLGSSFKKIGDNAKETGTSIVSAFSKINPVMIGAGAAIAAGVVAFEAWDKLTDTYAETQQKLASEITNLNSAQKQSAAIQEEIEANEKSIAEIRKAGVTNMAERAQIEALERQNAQLKVQKEYQDAIAKTAQSNAEAQALIALSNEKAYTTSGKKTGEGLFGKLGLFFTDIFDAYAKGQMMSSGAYTWEDISNATPSEGLYDSATDRFDKAITEYSEARAALERGGLTGEAYKTANERFAEASSNLSVLMTDFQEYSTALSEGTSKESRELADEIKNLLNRANVEINGKDSFLSNLISRTDGAEAKLRSLALTGKISVGRIKDAFPEMAKEAEAAGISLEYIVDTFRTLANGGNSSLSLTSNNLETVNSKINETAAAIASVAEQAKTGFAATGLTNEAYGALGASYANAMMFTGNGIRLNFREYQKSRASYSSKRKADIENEIATERKLIADVQARINKIPLFERNSSNTKYTNLYDMIVGSNQNIERLQVARAQINGLTSDVAQYLEVMEGAYSSTATVDSIAGGFVDLEKAFNEGRTSSAQVREFIELWTGKDLSGVSNSKLADYWNDAAEAFKKFNEASEDERGNATYKYNGESVMAFLRKTGDELDKGFVDADGNISLTSSDLLTLAKVAGISTSQMEELVLALSDFGHDVNISTTAKSLDQFTSKADKATAVLKKYNVENQNDVEAIQKARVAADEANDAAGLEQLNNAMVRALQLREELARSSDEASIMGVNAEGLEGEARTITELTQGVIEAQERLAAAEAAQSFGIDIDVESEVGKLENAYGKLAEYLKTSDLNLGAIGIDKNATVEEITRQLGTVDINSLAKFVAVIGINKSKVDAGIAAINHDLNPLENRWHYVNVGVNVTGVNRLTEAKAAIQGLSDKQVTVTTIHNDIRNVATGPIRHYTEYGGTAHASGYWGAKGGTSLVGELGTELYVDPRTSTWHTVGERGAEFAKIPHGAIVFNHKQTEEIFKNGVVTSGGGRGHWAYAAGTGSDVDFAAMRLARLQNTLDDYAALIEFYDSFKQKNAYGNKSLSAAKGLINENLSAASAYMAKANSLGLASGYVNQIRNGSLNIETIADENLRQKIQDYQQYYEAAEACKDAVAQLNNQIKELSRAKFDNIVEDADVLLAYEDSFIAYMKAVAELNKERNGTAAYGDLSGQGGNINRSINYLTKYITDLQAELDAQVKSGEITKWSQAWHEYVTKINSAKQSLAEHRMELEELNNSIRELNWTPFNEAIKKLKQTESEISSVYGLVSDLDAYTEKSINQNGITQLGILASSLKNARQAIADHQRAYAALDKELAAGVISQTEYNDAVAETNNNVNAAVAQAKSYRDAVISLVRDGINKETEAFEKLISARKENLSKQKEADNYAKTIADKTKAVSSIQAQIFALSGDSSQSTRGKLRALQSDLAKAEEDLAETRRDHEYTMLTAAYDEQLEQFRETQTEKLTELSTSLDAQNRAISTALSVARDNYSEIYGELTQIANIYGVTLNSDVVNPWKSAAAAVSEYESAVNRASSSIGITTNNYLKANTGKNPAGSFAENKYISGTSSSSSSKPASTATSKFRTTGDFWLRADAGTDKKGLYVIPNGTTLTSDGKKKSWGGYDWYHVNYGGTWGWTSGYGLQKLARGTKYALGGLALTDEHGLGSEAIITRDGALRQLNAGDMVFSADQKETLWRLSKTPAILAGGIGSAVGGRNVKQEVNLNYGSLLTVNGNVDRDALPSLERILEMASEKTRNDMYSTLQKIGIHK